MGVKLIIVGVLALVAFVSFFKMTYHVRSSVVLQPVEKRSICPPFDGSIEEVFFKPGEAVKKGQVLARMRTMEMTMKLADAKSQMRQYLSEADKNKFELPAKMGEYRVAMAKADEAQSQAALLDYQIKQADLLAPFDGVLLKGDLYDRQGAPAKQGDVLFEIAKSEEGHPDRIAVEAEIQVSERDIQEVRAFSQKHRPTDGKISTTSFPDKDHEFKITRIVPLGVPKEGENVFQVYADIPKAEPWMHPGLAGEARVDIEQRRVVWIWTHRLTDWLRLKLWI